MRPSMASADESANDGTPGEERPLGSAADCGRSSAAQVQRDCPAASQGMVSPVRVGLRALRSPPHPWPWWLSSVRGAPFCCALFVCGSRDESHDAQRPDVDLDGAPPAAYDLRRHAMRRPDHGESLGAFLGQLPRDVK